MYVSREVKTLREDPVAGEEIGLLLEVDTDEASMDAIGEAIDALGGTVEMERQFDTLEIVVQQEQVAAVCELDGLEGIETNHTLDYASDGVGEDIEYPEEGLDVDVDPE
jgi:hypothetical protein